MRCNRCRARPGTPVDVFKSDEFTGGGHLCDECMDECMDRFKQLQSIFAGLLECGVSNETANWLMIHCHPSDYGAGVRLTN